MGLSTVLTVLIAVLGCGGIGFAGGYWFAVFTERQRRLDQYERRRRLYVPYDGAQDELNQQT